MGSSEISLAYSKAVNDILSNHVGLLCKFVLYLPSWCPKEIDVNQWIQYARDSGVKEFTIENDVGPEKILPTSLFSCMDLTHLTLTRCKLLSLPPSFKGFPCLISLKLEACWYSSGPCIKTSVLEFLISKCPQLESLYLYIDETQASLTICAPKLKDLFLEGLLSNLCLEGTKVLNLLSVDIKCDTLQHSRHMSKFFCCLTNVEKLVLGESFWQSSPLLEQLYIEASIEDEVPDCQSIETDSSYILQCLKTVQLLGISGLSSELQLIKFLLSCSPVLEEITIELSTTMGGAKKLNFAKEAKQYHRASPNAEINIKTDKVLL